MGLWVSRYHGYLWVSVLSATRPIRDTSLPMAMHLESIQSYKRSSEHRLTRFASSVASWIKIWTRLLVETSFSWLEFLSRDASGVYMPCSFFSILFSAVFAKTSVDVFAWFLCRSFGEHHKCLSQSNGLKGLQGAVSPLPIQPMDRE